MSKACRLGRQARIDGQGGKEVSECNAANQTPPSEKATLWQCLGNVCIGQDKAADGDNVKLSGCSMPYLVSKTIHAKQ